MSSHVIKQAKEAFEWGSLLYAENLIKEMDEKLDPVIKEIKDRMSDIRSWKEMGKPSGYVDPPSWECMPKFQKACDAVKSEFGEKGIVLLDIGCFTGYFSRKMQQFGHDAHGCDIQDKLMKIINKKFFNSFHPVAGENVGAYFKPEMFHAVTLLDSLEHILDDSVTIIGAKRILKPGGLLIIHVPKGEDYPDDSKEHLRIYNNENLEKLIPGIKLEECKDEHGQPTIFGVWKKGLISKEGTIS